ncbi:hypothetical protein [Rhizobium paknamense]|uniref:Uncharacterized protein n=1 Tax=Rhizobium paknamense TaxID=1206817 RepID=A0ABU0IBH0_9HYPH|nr:hypothetical protein [Rhizobium paknamense]MDQ0454599.1 hypothetical protein [Rhizobium paknamense]
MSAAKDRLNAILIDLPAKNSQWEKNVVNPYVRAYDMAYGNYQKTLAAQAAHDRMVAELFVLAASVLTGSVMMAAFASSSLRVLAGRAMLQTICNNNLNRTFNAVHAVSNSQTAMFALGGVLDAAKSLAGKQVQAAVEDLTKSPPMAASPSALTFLTYMSDFVYTNHITLHKLVRGVLDDASITDDNKQKIADLVTRTPYWNAPENRRVDETSLSQKMELLFYMQAVLDSDFLVDTISVPVTTPYMTQSQIVEVGRKPIEIMPSSPNYPKLGAQKIGGSRGMDRTRSVEYNSLGSAIRNRINVVSQMAVGAPFYAENGMMASMFEKNSDRRDQLLKAEQIITRLALQTRPKQFTDVVML